MNFATNKQKWYEWEEVALDFYQKKWYEILHKNWTIPWWEIDLILQNKEKIVFLEVKNTVYVEDIYEYITPKKLKTLKKTIETYLWKFPTEKYVTLDIVFVKWNQILEIYKDVEI